MSHWNEGLVSIQGRSQCAQLQTIQNSYRHETLPSSPSCEKTANNVSIDSSPAATHTEQLDINSPPPVQDDVDTAAPTTNIAPPPPLPPPPPPLPPPLLCPVPDIDAASHRAVNNALKLKLSVLPHFSRDGKSIITIHPRKQANAVERNIIILTCLSWGYNTPNLPRHVRDKIAKAASLLVAYDCGFLCILAASQVGRNWMKNFSNYLETGNTTTLGPVVGGNQKKKYTDVIEMQHKGYLIELFRYAQSTLGHKATFQELSTTMNEKSSVPSETRATIALSHNQLYRWFQEVGGKEYSPVEKPLDTPRHRVERLKWVKLHFTLLTDKTKPVAFMDEKWFYTTSRRKKLKHIPIQAYEEPGADRIRRPHLVNRRYPVKSMFLGVVARPRPDINATKYNGMVHIERISEEKIISRRTSHQRFSEDLLVNNMIRNGTWKTLSDFSEPTWTGGEILEMVCFFYDLDDDTIDTLELQYRSFVKPRNENGESKTGLKMKVVKIDRNKQVFDGTYQVREKNLSLRNVTLQDLHIKCRKTAGSIERVDVNCDSKYMLEAMKRVGESIRTYFSYIPRDEPCYLILDNAGGHGSNEAKDSYQRTLLKEHNIVLIHQVPRSMYTNVLDLGFWCAIQSAVETNCRGKRCDKNVLCKVVMQTWKSKKLKHILLNVFDRLHKVLVLIAQANGSNELVETKRGKSFRNLDLWMLPDDIDERIKTASASYNSDSGIGALKEEGLDVEVDDRDDEEDNYYIEGDD